MILLERTSELDDLRRAVAQARAGKGQLVLVEGEAGVGKTALVRELLDAPVRADWNPLWTMCDPLGPPRALGLRRPR